MEPTLARTGALFFLARCFPGTLFFPARCFPGTTLENYVDEPEPTVLITVGFVLFGAPEPAPSTLGVGLMLLGIAWWLREWD